MAVVQADPLTQIRSFFQDKPAELKEHVDAWVKKQPAWVEGAVAGLQGSFQVGAAAA